MHKESQEKWAHLENMLYETPEKATQPSSIKGKANATTGRIFKFVRTSNSSNHASSVKTIPKSLNNLPFLTPEKKYSSKLDVDTNSRSNIDSRSYVAGTLNVLVTKEDSNDSNEGSKNGAGSRPAASFNSIDSDRELQEPASAKLYLKPKVSTFNHVRHISPSEPRDFIITSRNSKKKFSLRNEHNSSTTLEKMYKTSEPICGTSEIMFQVLFRKKCEDMEIIPSIETEEKFISNIRKKSLGTKLCFYESGFAKSALEKLGNIIDNNANVSQLILRKSYLATDDNMARFVKYIAKMPNLIHLDLANNALGGDDFAELFKGLTGNYTINSVDFSNYETDKKNKLGAKGIEAFREFVKDNIFLQHVTLSNMMLDDNSAAAIFSALEECPNLLTLNLTSNVFTGTCFENITELFAKTTLIKLDISGNKLKKEAASNLAKLIASLRIVEEEYTKDEKIRDGIELIMQDVSLGSEFNAILEALGRNANVRKLDFSNNLLTDIEITQFDTALENRRIQELNLTNCKMGEIQGKTLALGLKKNRGLEVLLLGNNNIGDNAGSLTIYSLLMNQRLTTIDLSQNRLANETAVTLMDIIKKNPNLTKFNLSNNNFDEDDGYSLQEALFFNAKITEFNLNYTRVKYNTAVAIEGIVKVNQEKILFGTVPKLKDEVGKRRQFIKEEKHTLNKVGDLDKKKDEIKRDIKRFKETLDDLKTREKSPTSKKKERIVMKLSKDIKEEQPKLEHVNAEIRDFLTAAQLEKESFMRMIEAEQLEVEKALKKLKAQEEEMEMLKKKYEPEIKIIKHEINKVADENKFNEMYNETINQKITKEKKIEVIQQTVNSAKVSDVFLATSELAKHIKKKDLGSPDMPLSAVLSDPKSGSDKSGNEKLSKELEYLMKTRQTRADKLINELNRKEENALKRKLRKTVSRSDNSKHDAIREKINEKLNNMMKAEDEIGAVDEGESYDEEL